MVVEPAQEPVLAVDGPFAATLPSDGGNLALAALLRLAEAVARPPDARIALTKRLPVAAGLGGGSADAAAVLRALVRLWALPPDLPAIRNVAAGLGADVPVCLDGRTSFVGGVGERLAPAPALGGVPILLVNPGRPVSTPAVFKARQGPYSAAARFEMAVGGPLRLAALLGARRNDLTEAACGLCPDIETVLAALRQRDGCLLARLSGSGATCFGLFAKVGDADDAAEALASAQPAWWIARADLL